MFGFLFLAPYARTTRYEEALRRLFLSWKIKEKNDRFARAPHYSLANLYRCYAINTAVVG